MNNHRGIIKVINHQKRNRHSIRLKGYDYSQPGMYFITLCTQNRQCIFGDVIDGRMILHDAGKMVKKIWDEIPLYYGGVNIDTMCVMPNHFHGIVILCTPAVGAGPSACPETTIESESGQLGIESGPRGSAPTLSLPDVVHRFKTMTTKKYCDGVKQYGWKPFNKKLWQRNYYEHIIRNKNEYERIHHYIENNPRKWKSNLSNPLNRYKNV